MAYGRGHSQGATRGRISATRLAWLKEAVTKDRAAATAKAEAAYQVWKATPQK